MKYVFQIEYLDIRESYFKGKVRFQDDELRHALDPQRKKTEMPRKTLAVEEAEEGIRSFTINIQDERRGKVLRLPFLLNTQKSVLVRCSGPGVSVEDCVEYRGESEWLEIDSDQITFYIADHQDQFDTIEIIEL